MLYQEVRKWELKKNVEYVELVERVVAEGFTRFVDSRPGEFKRRSTVPEIELAKKQVWTLLIGATYTGRVDNTQESIY